MKKAFLRQVIQFATIWSIIALAPAGRALLFFPNMPDKWFYFYLWIMGMVLCPLVILWFNFLQQKKQSWFMITLIQFGFAVIISVAFHVATFIPEGTMKRRISSAEFEKMNNVNRFSFSFFSGSTYSVFTSFMMLSALGLLIVYNEQLRQRKLSESELRETLMRTQIRALQSELQPHFIFNTLHTASSVMETDVERAQQLIERFSFLLRTYLELIDRNFYTLQEEIDFLQEYIEVLQFRYNGMIKLNLHMEENCLQRRVPVVLLQPIIENSVKHGWQDRQQHLVIDIHCEAQDQYMVIKISDNGSGTSSSDAKTGVGLRNLQERLRAYYGDRFSFEHEATKGYQSLLRLPLEEL